MQSDQDPNHNNWRSHAAAGKWDKVDADEIAALSPDYLTELKQVLEMVVPVIPTEFVGEGPLTGPVRARINDNKSVRKDVSFLYRHAGLQKHADNMKKVGDLLDRPGEWILEEDINREVRQLRHAAMELETIRDILGDLISEGPNNRWLSGAKSTAIAVLAERHINFESLPTTFVRYQKDISDFEEVSAASKSDQGVWSLETILDAPAELKGTTVWLAAAILSHVDEVDFLINASARTGVTEAETSAALSGDPEVVSALVVENMVDQSNLVGKAAMQLGLLMGALKAKALDKKLSAQQEQRKGAARGGSTISSDNRKRNIEIISKMDFHRNSNAPKLSIRKAAKLVYNEDRLGTSPKANEQLYARNKNKPLKY